MRTLKSFFVNKEYNFHTLLRIKSDYKIQEEEEEEEEEECKAWLYCYKNHKDVTK
jgi:hypothetical protein